MNRQVRYLICSVICHGECEMQLVSTIQNRYRRKLNPIGNNNGKSSIEIGSLTSFLSKRYPTINSYKNAYKNLLNIKKQMIIGHKIFTIMDQDQTSFEMIDKYKNKSLFKGYWFGDNNYIEPIYFIPNMDAVFNKHGFTIDTNNHKPAQYYKLFTTRYDDVIKMLNQLPLEETNIKVFLDYIKENA